MDAANPRWEQQVALSTRFFTELEFNQIPRLLVYNKTDLGVINQTTDAMVRQVSLRDEKEALAISSLDSHTLQPCCAALMLGFREISQQTRQSSTDYTD